MKKKNNSKCNGWLVRNMSDLIPLDRAGWQTERWAEPWLLHWASLLSVLLVPGKKLASKNLTSTEWLDVTGVWRRSFKVRKKLHLFRVTNLSRSWARGHPGSLLTKAFWDSLIDVCKLLLYPTWSSDVFEHRSFCLGNSAFSLQEWVVWLLTKLLPTWNGDCFQKVSLQGNHRHLSRSELYLKGNSQFPPWLFSSSSTEKKVKLKYAVLTFFFCLKFIKMLKPAF